MSSFLHFQPLAVLSAQLDEGFFILFFEFLISFSMLLLRFSPAALFAAIFIFFFLRFQACFAFFDYCRQLRASSLAAIASNSFSASSASFLRFSPSSPLLRAAFDDSLLLFIFAFDFIIFAIDSLDTFHFIFSPLFLLHAIAAFATLKIDASFSRFTPY